MHRPTMLVLQGTLITAASDQGRPLQLSLFQGHAQQLGQDQPVSFTQQSRTNKSGMNLAKGWWGVHPMLHQQDQCLYAAIMVRSGRGRGVPCPDSNIQRRLLHASLHHQAPNRAAM